MLPREVIQAIAKKTGDIGSSFYFEPETLAAGRQLGLDGFRFYFAGRGGVLGDVEAGVVRSAFGYFEPGLLAGMWNSARKVVAPRDAARAYVAAAAAYGRRTFGELSGLDAYVDAAAVVIANVDGGAMPLFAGLRAETTPSDAPGAAMHQAMVLRELRGGAHLAALTVLGVRSEVAHAITRPNDVELFGWKDRPPVVNDIDRERRAHAEQLTEDALVPAFSTLTEAQSAALVAGTEAMYGALQPTPGA